MLFRSVAKGAGISPLLATPLRKNAIQKAVRTPPEMTLEPLLPTGVAGGAGGAVEVVVEAGGLRAPRPRLTEAAPTGPRVSKTWVAGAVGVPGVEAALRSRPCLGRLTARPPRHQKGWGGPAPRLARAASVVRTGERCLASFNPF